MLCGKRILTGVIGGLLILFIFFLDSLQLFKGPLFFNIAMAIVAFLMCHEFYKATEAKGYKPIKFLGYLCTLFLIPVGVVKTQTLALICVSLIPFVIFIGMAVSIFSKLKYNIVDVAITLLGNIYTVFMVAFISSTRAMPMGVFLIFYILCGAWFTDIFAFIFGKAFGKHKISEISPKKSWEGSIAGVFGTVIFVIVYSLCLNNLNFEDFRETSSEMSSIVQIEELKEAEQKIEETEKENTILQKLIQGKDPQADFEMQEKLKKHFYTNIPLLVFIGIVISIISQIGDFSASAIKRYCDIKDFSNLMPGHGGMLDRFDSIIFVAPLVYLIFYYIMRFL